jgi:GT2 family glycosyltransferase
LRSYYELFSNAPSLYAAGGPIIPLYETNAPKWISYHTKILLTGYLYQGKKIRKFKNRYPGGGNAAYRKEVFEKVGHFNVDLGRKGDNLMGAEEKDIFDKMGAEGMKIIYTPNAILYHIIPEIKLTDQYFKRLTLSIGKSERERTLRISKIKYLKRLFLESVKWAGAIVLCIGYSILSFPRKGGKLIAFRWNVSKGLLGVNSNMN